LCLKNSVINPDRYDDRMLPSFALQGERSQNLVLYPRATN
jgi:hypothetical protein